MGDYHKVLGVREEATDAEIKKAYRKLASELHPDKHVGKSDDEIQSKKEKFQEIQAAYDGLTKKGRTGPVKSGFGNADINKEMEEMMRRWASEAWGAGQQAHRSHTSSGVTTQTVAVPIEKMLQGGIVTFTTMIPTQIAQGTIQFIRKVWTVKLEPDTPVGHEVTINEANKKTKFIIQPQDSPTCMAQGIDLLMEKDIELFDALVGGTINLKHPSNVTLKVRVPAGVTDESVVRVHGKGLLDTKGTRGDLYIHTTIVIPKLNTEERKILKEAIKKIKKK